MSKIVPLTEGHCAEVARLHSDHLPTGFRGRPGLAMLAAYYEALVQSDGSCGFVAEQSGQVAGYVCGVWEPTSVRGTLLRLKWPVLVLWGLAEAVVSPRLLGSLLGRMWGSGSNRAAAGSEYELRPIVVAPAMRGSGIGTQLVEALLEDAGWRGFDRVHLYAEKGDVIANAFYRRVGFQLADEPNGASESRRRYEYLLAGP